MTQTHSPATEKNTKRAKGDDEWKKEKKRNVASPNGSKDKANARIEHSLQTKRWKTARALIQEQLVYEPSDHWLWLSLGLTYYEQQEYEKSLKCSQWAVQLEARCPLALWHLAGSLYMT